MLPLPHNTLESLSPFFFIALKYNKILERNICFLCPVYLNCKLLNRVSLVLNLQFKQKSWFSMQPLERICAMKICDLHM